MVTMPEYRTKFENNVKTLIVEKDFASFDSQPAVALAFHPIRIPPFLESTIHFRHLKNFPWTLKN